MFRLKGHNRVSNNNNNKSVVLVTHQADVSINRLLLLLLLLLLWRFTRTHKSGDVLCIISCIFGTIVCHYGDMLCTILCILGHNRVSNNNNNDKSVILVTHQADVSTNRLLLLLLVLLWRFTRTHKSGDVLCIISCILGPIMCHYVSLWIGERM